MASETILDEQELASIPQGDRCVHYATVTEQFVSGPPQVEVYILHDDTADVESWPEDLQTWLTISLFQLTRVVLEDWGQMCRSRVDHEVLVYSEAVEEAKRAGRAIDVITARIRRDVTLDYTNQVGRRIQPPITAREVENP